MTRRTDLTPVRALRRGHFNEQAHGCHGEHGGANSAEAPVQQQLPVILGKGARCRGRSNNQDAQNIGAALTHPLHEPAAQRRKKQPGEGKGADHYGGGADADVEALRELRQHGSHDPKANGNHECGSDQHLDLAGELHRGQIE